MKGSNIHTCVISLFLHILSAKFNTHIPFRAFFNLSTSFHPHQHYYLNIIISYLDNFKDSELVYLLSLLSEARVSFLMYKSDLVTSQHNPT